MNKYHVIAIILLVSFAVLSSLVIVKGSSSAITQADYNAFLSLNNSHVSSLNEFMILLTQYGREVFWIATIILIFLFGGWTGKKTAFVMAISMLVLIPIGSVAKDVIARARPIIPTSDIILASDTDRSFPSGHSVIVSAGAAVALALFRNTGKKLAISIGLAAEAALVCISRVYVGGHYPTDVLGGILLGAGVSFIFVGFVVNIEKMMEPIVKILNVKRSDSSN